MVLQRIVTDGNQGGRPAQQSRQGPTLQMAESARKLIGTDDVVGGNDMRYVQSPIGEHYGCSGGQPLRMDDAKSARAQQLPDGRPQPAVPPDDRRFDGLHVRPIAQVVPESAERLVGRAHESEMISGVAQRAIVVDEIRANTADRPAQDRQHPSITGPTGRGHHGSWPSKTAS